MARSLNLTQTLSQKLCVSFSLALSVFASSLPLAYSAPGDINSVNDGQTVVGGTYYNTAGNKTTFQNSAGNGLHLKAGTTVTGLETTVAGALTGNGGWIHFNAAGQAVRLDGNINVSAALGGSGYQGNGGKVTVNAAYLYQNGQIFAQGANGGSVQFNVGSAMFGPGAKIDVRGFGNGVDAGLGGQIDVRAAGIVDVAQGAIFDASGKLSGVFDTTLINIEGGLINVEGVLRADGVLVDGSVSDGGVIRLVASGLNTAEMAVACVDCAIVKSEGVFTESERQDIINRQNQLAANANGDVMIADGAEVTANGVDGNDDYKDASGGGSIIAMAVDDVVIDGTVQANGGNGADSEQAAGNGGNGGAIGLIAGDKVVNNGTVQANGGNGGNSTGLVNNYTSDNGSDIGFGESSTVSDASGHTGGHGGSGGAIAISALSEVNNTNLIEANGGNGGKGGDAYASDYDPTRYEAPEADAIAQAEAYAGNGGNAGSGGVVVVSADVNPTGGGSIKANAGLAGNGGDATAIAGTYGSNSSDATASAIAGNAGQAAEAGLAVVNNPATVAGDQTIESEAFKTQESGRARSVANAYGPAITEATAYSETGYNGRATADANAEQINAPIPLDPTATATAISGDFGVSEATAKANGTGPTNAFSNAQSGESGKAIANSRSNSSAAAAVASAIANTLNNGYSSADARATSGLNDTNNFGADSYASATSGNFGTALSKATGNTKTGASDSKAIAEGTVGDDGFVEVITFSDASDDGYTQSNANGGDRTVAKSKTDNLSEDNTIQSGVQAIAGNDSYVEALGNTRSGRNVSNAVTLATALDNSVAYANNIVNAQNVVALSSAEAHTGNNGISKATIATKTGNGTSDDATANVVATTGNDGQADASLLVEAGDDANGTAFARTGERGYSVASAVAKSSKTAGTGRANSDAEAESGTDGTSRAITQSVSATGFGDAQSLATLNNGGAGLAQANVTGGNSQAKITGNGPDIQDNDSAAIANSATSQINRGSANPQTVDASNTLTNVATMPAANMAPMTNVPAQLQNNEMLIHNNTSFFLSLGNNGTVFDIISDSAANNADRAVTHKFGGAQGVYPPINVRHAVIADQSNPTLAIDANIMPNLSTLNVLKNGDIEMAADHDVEKALAFISTNGKFTNNYSQSAFGGFNSGSILVSTQSDDNTDGIFNNGQLTALDNGSVVLTSNQSIYNYPNGVIDVSGDAIGGVIQLSAADSIFNAGLILADSFGGSDSANIGGQIISKAGNLNINNGVYSAAVNSFFTRVSTLNDNYGGYVRFHGNTLAFNDEGATIEADGGSTGGQIAFTSGDNNPANNGRPITAPPLLGWTPSVTAGSSTFDGTTFASGIFTGFAESALTYGNMSVFGSTTAGDIRLGGNTQVGIGQNATFTGNLFTYAGAGAVQAAACNILPGGGGPGPVVPPGPAGGPIVATLSNNDGGNDNSLGLFQEQRFVPIDEIPFFPFRMILNLPQPNLFLSSVYQPVTEEILALAFDEYNRQVASGQIEGEARRQTQTFLGLSGITPEVAQIIVQQIEQGRLVATDIVFDALKTIESELDTEPTVGKDDKLVQ